MAEAVLAVTLPDELWYFNGEAPEGYATKVIIGIAQQQGSFLWSVAPAGRLRISSHTSPTPEITTMEPSASRGDVRVTCRWVGPTGAKNLFATSTTVLAPDRLEHLHEVDSAHPGYGYESHIHYLGFKESSQHL